MTVRLDRRLAVLGAAIAGPPAALVLAGLVPAPRLAALGAIAVVSAGLLAMEAELRQAGLAHGAGPATLLTLYGTGLVWHETREPGAGALAFVAGTLLLRAWRTRAGDGLVALARGAALGLASIAVALLAEVGTGAAPALGRPLLLDSVFSSRHGLLFWTPVLTLGLFGLLGRAARGHSDAAGALTALAVMALANGSLRPWWAGGFANARVLPALPFIALGLAALLGALRETARRRPMRLAAAAAGLLVAWNVLRMAQYRAETIPRDDTVSFPAVAENSARLLSAAVGSPVAWPANWIFAARHALPAARYELVAGQDVLAGGRTRIALGDLEAEAAFLGEGWSVRHPCGSAVCREVEGRACLFLPVVDARPADLRVRVHGSGVLRLLLNGRTLSPMPLASAPTEWAAAAAGLRPGLNELVFEVSPGGQALVEAVTVTR